MFDREVVAKAPQPASAPPHSQPHGPLESLLAPRFAPTTPRRSRPASRPAKTSRPLVVEAQAVDHRPIAAEAEHARARGCRFAARASPSRTLRSRSPPPAWRPELPHPCRSRRRDRSGSAAAVRPASSPDARRRDQDHAGRTRPSTLGSPTRGPVFRVDAPKGRGRQVVQAHRTRAPDRGDQDQAALSVQRQIAPSTPLLPGSVVGKGAGTVGRRARAPISDPRPAVRRQFAAAQGPPAHESAAAPSRPPGGGGEVNIALLQIESASLEPLGGFLRSSTRISAGSCRP